jgi:hypothetical protein
MGDGTDGMEYVLRGERLIGTASTESREGLDRWNLENEKKKRNEGNG